MSYGISWSICIFKCCITWLSWVRHKTIVYFYQQTGALHTVCWFEIIFSAFSHHFHKKGKREKNIQKSKKKNFFKIFLNFWRNIFQNVGDAIFYSTNIKNSKYFRYVLSQRNLFVERKRFYRRKVEELELSLYSRRWDLNSVFRL